MGTERMTIGEAKRIVGSLSFESKMPSTSYSLPAQNCILGAKLAKIDGTACSICYALKTGGGRAAYEMLNVRKAMQKRLASLNHPYWIDAMTVLLRNVHRGRIKVDLGAPGIRHGQRYRYNAPGFHRWHGSGDLQSVEHLSMICEVARRTPKIKHWLPTQELGMVRVYLAAGGVVPPNLVIRISSVKIDDRRCRAWPHTSSVFRDAEPLGFECEARHRGNHCGSCRACWDSAIPHVSYPLH